MLAHKLTSYIDAYTAEEIRQTEEAYEGLLNSIKSGMDDHDRVQMRQAFELARDAHSVQRRKSGEAYIFHPISVARISAEEIGLGPTAIVAALLHDIVEDTPVTLEEINKIFGSVIGEIVDGLTKLDSAYNYDSPQAENFKKVLSTLVKDVRVVLIKMADRLHNMRTLGAMPPHKQLRIAAETSYIYAPLAHRLGLYAIKTEFLDLCMKVTDPEDYKSIAKQLSETKKSRESYIEHFIDPVKEKISTLNLPFRILGRPKSIYSIWKKIQNKDVEFEEIYDLFAIRIILDVPLEEEKLACWQVYSVITDVFKPIPERTKDWISLPKANGYESLHTTVIGPKGRFVEVQIRTERMDDIAERGFAAHWKYKGMNDQPDVYEKWLDSVRDILEDPNTNAVEFLGDFKDNNLFNEEVYVYTPNGDLKVLPKGSTALDFAFSIHSDVGYHCTTVRVNDRIVPMGHELQNGDQVFVITNPHQKPSEDWLKMVKTGKSRSRIRSAMKEERRKKGEFGKEALMRKLKKWKVNFDESVELLCQHFGFESHVDLFFALATNALQISEISKAFKPDRGKLVEIVDESVEVARESEEAESPQKKRKKDFIPRLVINGEPAERFEYHFATCCNPLQGDEVFAFLTTNAGLKIHRTNCPNATHLMAQYGYRVMKAEWVEASGSASFVANLKITGIDKGPGVIQQLTNQLTTQLGLDIRAFSIEGNEGFFEGHIGIKVANKDQLNLVVKELKSLDSVTNVERIA